MSLFSSKVFIKLGMNPSKISQNWIIIYSLFSVFDSSFACRVLGLEREDSDA